MKISSSLRRKINLTTGIPVVFRGLNLFFNAEKLDKLAFCNSLSSAAFYVGEVGNDPLVVDRNLWGLSIDWREFLCERRDATLDAIRSATRTDRPEGDHNFINKIERLTGQSLSKRKPGRRQADKLSVMSQE